MQACFAAPVLVSGEGRFDTEIMRALAPSCFVKGGAEGVHCAALPELGLGVALKIDDGAKRGTEVALGTTLAALLPSAQKALRDYIEGEIETLRGARAGRIGASAELQTALSELAARA
jgi:L-asparaginase II